MLLFLTIQLSTISGDAAHALHIGLSHALQLISRMDVDMLKEIQDAHNLAPFLFCAISISQVFMGICDYITMESLDTKAVAYIMPQSSGKKQ